MNAVEKEPCKKRGPVPAAVDLFCGAGGLSYGMQRAGVRVCAGIDMDAACRYPFEANVGARFYEADAADISPEFVESLFPEDCPSVLAGCAPCQPFSTYSRHGSGDRWKLLSKFGDLVDRLRPDVVTMENVPGLMRHPVFERYVETLKRAGYHCGYSVVPCAEYGVPQTRKRLVLLASRLGDIKLGPPTHCEGTFVTVGDAIRHLEPIRAGDTLPADRLHKASSMSAKNMRRILSSAPGGTWSDWDAGLRATCHARAAGRSYRSVYGRMEWDKPGPTITTQFYGFGHGRFGHPEQDRAISLREGALLQTFPPEYAFVPDGEDVYLNRIGRLIGNAVPVRLGAAIGRCIVKHVEDHSGR